MASCCDVFYIGGTKVGALFGEAVVFTRPQLAEHFFSVARRHGAVLAKGRLPGLRFDTLFTDGLCLRIAARAGACLPPWMPAGDACRAGTSVLSFRGQQ